MNRTLQYAAVIVLLGSALAGLSCERPTSPPNPNAPPDTRLANIPTDHDTIFALATLNWSGGDNDGFITSFQFRYYTDHLQPGTQTWVPFDSTQWVDTTGSSVTVAFNSSDELNRQRILVRAVDNEGNIDPTPAERMVYTLRTTPPVTTILQPAKGGHVLASEHLSDWWSGIQLSFKAEDRTQFGAIADYAWSVDGGPWTWTTDTTVFVAPELFASPLNGPHMLRVISRNNTNLIDPVGDSAVVNVVVPSFEKPILIIDETDEFNNPFITLRISDATVDAFYAEVFPGSESWDFKTQGMPPREVLARYKLVIWQADDVPATRPHKISEAANIEIFTDYLKVGGKFLMSGWRILKSFAYFNNFPFTFQPGTFVHDYLHIRMVTETDILGDCTGGKGKTGSFSNFRADSAKLAFFPYNGKLSQVNIINSQAGFTDILYSYVNADNSPNVTLRGGTIALRYYGTVFDAVVLGFPMYFVHMDDAKMMARELLQSLHIQ